MRYRLLGPLQVAQGDTPLDIGPPKQRAVLAALLLAQGRVVSVDRLVDAVWGTTFPPARRPACRPTSPTCAAVEAARWDEALAEADASLALVPVLAQATGLDLDTLADYLDEAADERIIISAHGGDGTGSPTGCSASSCWQACPRCGDNACTPRSLTFCRTAPSGTHRRGAPSTSSPRSLSSNRPPWYRHAGWPPNRLPHNGVRISPPAGGRPRWAPTTGCLWTCATTGNATR